MPSHAMDLSWAERTVIVLKDPLQRSFLVREVLGGEHGLAVWILAGDAHWSIGWTKTPVHHVPSQGSDQGGQTSLPEYA